MPCVFLNNVPDSFTGHSSAWCETDNFSHTLNLYTQIAKAAGCQIKDVEIHLSSEHYQILSPAGYIVACPNIHGFVFWLGQEKRDDQVKQKIADALQYYLNQFGIGKGFDLTFMDMPAGSFFVEQDGKSIMVKGGDPAMPFSQLYYTVFDKTGFTFPGRDPEGVCLE